MGPVAADLKLGGVMPAPLPLGGPGGPLGPPGGWNGLELLEPGPRGPCRGDLP